VASDDMTDLAVRLDQSHRAYCAGREAMDQGDYRTAIQYFIDGNTAYLDRALEMKPDYKRARELRNLLAAKR
jgi:hypothetical protein